MESPSDRISSGLYGIPYVDVAPEGQWEDDNPYGQAVGCSASQYTSVTTVVTSGNRKLFQELRSHEKDTRTGNEADGDVKTSNWKCD